MKFVRYAAATLVGAGVAGALSRRLRPVRPYTVALDDADWLGLFYESVEDYLLMKLVKNQNKNQGGMARWGARHAFTPMNRIRNEIDRLLEDPLDWLAPAGMVEGWSPAVDIYDEKDHITVKAELPGMKKEDIEVSAVGDTLTLSGERKQEEEKEEGGFYRAERFYGRFQRTFTLPQVVDPQKIEASYKDGVLTVTCPKSEAAKPKQIEI